MCLMILDVVTEYSINFHNECGHLTITFVSHQVAEMIRHTIDGHTTPIPAILEIPSKDHPYDPSKDSILRRAKGLFNADDLR